MEAAPVLTPEAIFTLALTAGALVLFAWNRLRTDVVALLVMTTLIVAGIVTPGEGIRGFAHEATITVALMFVLAAGLLRTGALDPVVRLLTRVANRGELHLLATMLAITVSVSAIINNTAAVAVLMPMLLGLSRRTDTAPSRLLMPLSFGSQLGGSLTLIGTSTNLLVAGIALDLGVERIRLFDITPPALLVVAAGVLYLVTIGRWLLPTRAAETDLLRGYELHDYLAVLRVPADSQLAGRSLADTQLGSLHGIEVIFIDRGESRLTPTGSTVLQAHDRLLVQGKVAELASIEKGGPRLEFVDVELSRALAQVAPDDPAHFAEVLVPSRSVAVGRTLRRLALRARFGVSALALRRHGTSLRAIAQEPLRSGDIMLVRGTTEQLKRLHEESGLVLLGALDLPTVRHERRTITVAIMAGVVLLPALGIAPILVSALLGVLAMLLTNALRPDEAYEAVDWMVIVLLAAVLPLGEAMHATGAAGWLAHHLLAMVAPLGPYGILAGVIVLTSAMTAIISNAAAGAVLAPVAIAVAAGGGYSALPFVIGVMIGASNSFVTPVGYQTNMMIYGPGGYRFSDYVRVGGPLSVIVVLAATLAVPIFFPFR